MASSSKQNTSELRVKESEESNASSLNAKAEALHAFCTITTMLLLIQSKGSTAGNQPKLGRQEKILLQLLDVFTAILVRNNGVIIVTAQPYDGSGKVEVLASYLGNGDSLTISQPIPWPTHKFNMECFRFSESTRFDHKTVNCG